MRSFLLAIVLTACACGGTAPAGGPAAPTTTRASTEADPTGGYEVHEWGLVRALPGDTLNAGVIAPARPSIPMAVDKPVLYFHTDAPLTLRSVRVDASPGTIAEVWPEPPRTGEAWIVDWRDVALAPIADCPLSPLPPRTSPGCTSLPAGELCEVPMLGVVRVPGAVCVRTGGVVDTMLFYRARTRALTPPLRFERTAVREDVTVTNEGTEPIPGWLVRLHDDGYTVRALAVRPPAPGASIVVGHDFAAAALTDEDRATADEAVDMPVAPGSPEPGRRALRGSMLEIGLTEGEADAFLRAWDERLFGLAGAAADGIADDVVDRLSDGTVVDGDLGPTESFVYFLPPSSVETVARLTFDPPPQSVHRAMAMWSPIPASGPSH